MVGNIGGDIMKMCGIEINKVYGVVPVKVMSIALNPQPEPENYSMDDLRGKRGVRMGIIKIDNT